MQQRTRGSILIFRCARLVFAALGLSFVITSAAIADTYRVSFTRARADDDGAMRRADVTAILTPENGRVGMSRSAEDTGFYHGWAMFVLDISATDTEGQPLELSYESPGRWRVLGWCNGEITLQYSVALQHDRLPNLPGDDELAYARSYGVMWTGRALFIEGALSADISLEFEGPDGWRVTSPWIASDSTGMKFKPSTTDDLLNSAFFAGLHSEQVLASGARIATAPDMTSEAAFYTEALGAALAGYECLFAAAAPQSPVVIGARGSFWGGGVVGRSISMMHGGALDKGTSAMARHVIDHEIFHLWNSQWRYDEAERTALAWLSEGVAEYYAAILGARAGAMGDDLLLEDIAQRYADYRNALIGGSLVDAGTTKLEDQSSYDRVYSGGFVASMALDLLVRGQSGGERSLDDVMRRIHAEYSDPDGPQLTRRRVIDAIREETGFDPERFFSAYIDQAKPIPLQELALVVGVCLSAAEANQEWQATAERCAVPDRSQTENWARWLRQTH